MRYLNGRNRITKAGGSGSGSGGGGGDVNKYEITTQLAMIVNIQTVVNATTITIAGDFVAALPAGIVMLIDGSTGGTNDGIYIVLSATLNGGNTDVVFESANLQTGLAQNGDSYHPKTTSINHNLDSTYLVTSVRHETSGKLYSVEEQPANSNTLNLLPEVPIKGNFLVTVMA